MTRAEERRAELLEAVERISQAMLDDYEITEEPVFGGFMASKTVVRTSYDDLRIVLEFVDDALLLEKKDA
jgi:hypothetical protein